VNRRARLRSSGQGGRCREVAGAARTASGGPSFEVSASQQRSGQTGPARPEARREARPGARPEQRPAGPNPVEGCRREVVGTPHPFDHGAWPAIPGSGVRTPRQQAEPRAAAKRREARRAENPWTTPPDGPRMKRGRGFMLATLRLAATERDLMHVQGSRELGRAGRDHRGLLARQRLLDAVASRVAPRVLGLSRALPGPPLPYSGNPSERVT